MKKIKIIILVIVPLLFITACSCSKGRSFEDLIKLFIKTYTEADVNTVKEIFPSFYIEYARSYMTKEYLESALAKDKEEYGDDFNITYEIGKETKLNDDELQELNNKMANFFSTEEKASECYKYDGKLTYKGSKKENSQSLSSFNYCKYNDEWYLVRN